MGTYYHGLLFRQHMNIFKEIGLGLGRDEEIDPFLDFFSHFERIHSPWNIAKIGISNNNPMEQSLENGPVVTTFFNQIKELHFC